MSILIEVLMVVKVWELCSYTPTILPFSDHLANALVLRSNFKCN